jgi:hypothetical protein
MGVLVEVVQKGGCVGTSTFFFIRARLGVTRACACVYACACVCVRTRTRYAYMCVRTRVCARVCAHAFKQRYNATCAESAVSSLLAINRQRKGPLCACNR